MAVSRSKRVGVGAVLIVVAVIVVLAVAKSQQGPVTPQIGTGCLARDGQVDIPLTTDQAAIASTIAGVAARRSMPPRAVTIAYATALQESDLLDLPYGDRDSVGVFQQRPSQGWGTRRQILNPVYASTRFFAALALVPDYLRLPVYQAAQDVQRSADGTAYSQYAPQGAAMAGPFTGNTARAVWCWYGAGVKGRGRLALAAAELRRTFGPLRLGHFGDPVMQVRAGGPAAGWAVASWLVTHAGVYGIKSVRYQGYEWISAHGVKGWLADRSARDRRAARLAIVFG